MNRYIFTILCLLPLNAEGRTADINTDLVSAWYACSLTILNNAGVSDWSLPLKYKRHAVRKDPQFLTLMHAVIHKESNFKGDLVSTAKAYGLMQVTEVAMLESAKHCRLPIIPMAKLFDTATNIRYGSCYLDYALKQTGGDVDRALIIYNGGRRQLEKYDQGYTIASETANYVIGVRRVMNLCQAH